jgi:hypothetical protein
VRLESRNKLAMHLLHDDDKREHACRPVTGLADTKAGTFTQELYDEAKAKDWIVISIKNDWKRVFASVRIIFPEA